MQIQACHPSISQHATFGHPPRPAHQYAGFPVCSPPSAICPPSSFPFRRTPISQPATYTHTYPFLFYLCLSFLLPYNFPYHQHLAPDPQSFISSAETSRPLHQRRGWPSSGHDLCCSGSPDRHHTISSSECPRLNSLHPQQKGVVGFLVPSSPSTYTTPHRERASDLESPTV